MQVIVMITNLHCIISQFYTIYRRETPLSLKKKKKKKDDQYVQPCDEVY